MPVNFELQCKLSLRIEQKTRPLQQVATRLLTGAGDSSVSMYAALALLGFETLG